MKSQNDEKEANVVQLVKKQYCKVALMSKINVWIVAGCTPKSFWLLARHGTRNPGKKDMVGTLTTWYGTW